MARFWAGLQQWQTLVGATVAIAAAIIALFNTTRTLRQNQNLETERRKRKHAALRAMLPLALAKVSEYSEQSAHDLKELLNRCDTNEALPKGVISRSLIQPLPSETLKVLADFIEYSDSINASILESTVASGFRFTTHGCTTFLSEIKMQKVLLSAQTLKAASLTLPRYMQALKQCLATHGVAGQNCPKE